MISVCVQGGFLTGAIVAQCNNGPDHVVYIRSTSATMMLTCEACDLLVREKEREVDELRVQALEDARVANRRTRVQELADIAAEARRLNERPQRGVTQDQVDATTEHLAALAKAGLEAAKGDTVLAIPTEPDPADATIRFSLLELA